MYLSGRRMRVRPSLIREVCLSVLKLSGWNLSKSLISIAGSGGNQPDRTIYYIFGVFIPVTRWGRFYTRYSWSVLGAEYVKGRRKRFRPYKVCKFLIMITSHAEGSVSDPLPQTRRARGLSVRMNAEIHGNYKSCHTGIRSGWTLRSRGWTLRSRSSDERWDLGKLRARLSRFGGECWDLGN